MHSNQEGRFEYTRSPLFHELVRRGHAASFGEARRMVRARWVIVGQEIATDEAMLVGKLAMIRVRQAAEMQGKLDEAQEKTEAFRRGMSMQSMIDELNIWKDAYCGCRDLLVDVVHMLENSPHYLSSIHPKDEKTARSVMGIIASPYAIADILAARIVPERRKEFFNFLADEIRLSGWPEADVSDADA